MARPVAPTPKQTQRFERLRRRKKAGKSYNEDRFQKLKGLHNPEVPGSGATPGGVPGATWGNPNTPENMANNWETWNPGGAPVSPEFIQAAMSQGLSKQQIKQIFKSQALGGPQTSSSFSSPELLNYFTQNPSFIGQLSQAVQGAQGQPKSYAEYLAAGGQPGGYRSYGQQLQESVLGIGGARDAFLAGTDRAKAIAAGLDPRKASSAYWVQKTLDPNFNPFPADSGTSGVKQAQWSTPQGLQGLNPRPGAQQQQQQNQAPVNPGMGQFGNENYLRLMQLLQGGGF